MFDLELDFGMSVSNLREVPILADAGPHTFSTNSECFVAIVLQILAGLGVLSHKVLDVKIS